MAELCLRTSIRRRISGKVLKHLLALQIQRRQYDEAASTVSEALKISISRGISDQARQIEELTMRHRLQLELEVPIDSKPQGRGQ
jgi:hypothetical protein